MNESEAVWPRINQVLARRGMGSRRQMDQWVAAGQISWKGKVVQTGARVPWDADVCVKGQAIPLPQATQVWLFHKPKYCLVSQFDPQGRPLMGDFLPPHVKVMPTVGRLDWDSEGLLILTNDGHLSRCMEHPQQHFPRTYEVHVYGNISEREIRDAAHYGMTIEGVTYGPWTLNSYDHHMRHNSFKLMMTLYEGKNREIRRMVEAWGGQVERLKRWAYGPYALGSLAVGACVQAAVPQNWENF